MPVLLSRRRGERASLTMPSTLIEDFEDGPAARRELGEYLVDAIDDPLSVDGWEKRFAYWWDENPAAELHPSRGWTLRENGRLAGFLALIPQGYSVKGELTPALAASTWVIDPSCRNASLPMFMRLQRLGRETLIADTTPSSEVQTLLKRSGWRAATQVRRRYYSAVPGLNAGWPRLKKGLRLTSDLSDVKSLPRAFQRDDRIEKWVTLNSLRWQLQSPTQPHRFLGVINAKGVLTSFIIMIEKPIRGVPAWSVIEAWSSHPEPEELHAMTGAWMSGSAQTDLPWRPLVSVAEFAPDGRWKGTPALHARNQTVCHFFVLPCTMTDIPKHTVMAEGDLTL